MRQFKKGTLLWIVVIFTLGLAGCSVKKQIAVDETYVMSFENDIEEAKKSELYRHIMAGLKSDPGIGCVLASDKEAAAQAARIFDELVSGRPDPLRFITTKSSPKVAATRIAEQFKSNLFARMDKIFRVDAKTMQCKKLELTRYNAMVTEESPSKGVINISATLSKECNQIQAIPFVVEARGWVTNNATIHFPINYTQTAPGQMHIEAGMLSSERSLNAKLNNKEIIAAFKEIPATYKSEYDALTQEIQGEIADNLYYKRFIKKQSSASHRKIKEEKSYNADFNTVVSRIQRRLERYKYDAAESTFTFKDKKQFEYCNGNTGNYLDIETKVKVFPESNSKTAIVYESEIDLFYDKLLKKTADGHAKIEHKAFVNIVEKTLIQ